MSDFDLFKKKRIDNFNICDNGTCIKRIVKTHCADKFTREQEMRLCFREKPTLNCNKVIIISNN